MGDFWKLIIGVQNPLCFAAKILTDPCRYQVNLVPVEQCYAQLLLELGDLPAELSTPE